MGNYNSHAPYILGEEWVPIRDENLTFSPAVNVVERGHRFTTTASRTLQDARFYLNDFPPGGMDNQIYMAAIYPTGQEALTGPVRQVVIPISAVTTTGTGFGLTSFSNTNLEALQSPGDSLAITVTPNTNLSAKELNMYFGVNQYAQALQGKRILSVKLLYQLTWDPILSGSPGVIADRQVVFNSSQSMRMEAGGAVITGQEYAPTVGTYGSGILNMVQTIGLPGAATQIDELSFGEINMIWETPANATTTSQKMPWRFAELSRFEFGTTPANQMRLHWDFGGSSSWAGIFYLGYAALEVRYCEETRVAYGGRIFGNGSIRRPYVLGANPITLRDTSFATNPVLPAGSYSLVVSSADIGNLPGPFAVVQQTRSAADNTYPSLNAIRELYEIPLHQGVQVNVTQKVGETFTEESSHILPQLSLHTTTAGAAVTEVHSYGRQVAAQVYGSITATQEIYDDITGINASYPQVRYYARRFGSTSVPLTLAGTGVFTTSTASISPDAFDALDEIVDGWKEVNLRFSVSPSMGAATGTPGWTWSAPGELAGSRWEILGACAPAISGVPSNFLNLAPEQLSTTTYQPPAGNTVELTWMPQGIGSPPVSGMSSDVTSDAVLMFSQDSPVITGVAVNVTSQAITGFADCVGHGPCCIPSAISYNRITWSTPQVMYDLFERVVVGGWSNATSGQTWQNDFADSDTNVSGGVGTIQPSVLADGRNEWIDVASTDIDVRVDFQLNALPATGTVRVGLVGRLTDGDNTYLCYASITTTGVVTLTISRVVAGVETVITSMVMPYPLIVNTAYTMEFVVTATLLRARMWKTADDTPGFQLATTDATITSGSNAGVYVRNDTAVTTHIFMFDNFQATPPTFGTYELQRNDSVTNEWQTIMLATSPIITGFSDYEARVGVTSSYQIRQINLLSFAGPWSATGTATIPEPGVTMPSCGTNKRGVLIFTSNESQSGQYNLAYAMTWSGAPSEDFQFTEAGNVDFSQQFDRDFQVAFHGSERGGEVFQRNMLLANAGIPLPRLGNTHSLRDMAWADLPYVCVRDDIGDRWFATVIVPQGTVKHKRRIYNAQITVVETTDTASPVNP